LQIDTAHVLLVGSSPRLTAAGSRSLERAGWSAVSVVGAEAGLEAIEKHRVDALVLGGPAALRASDELVAALRRHHPLAMVIVPSGPDRIVDALEAAFGDDPQ
jgi:DNA-binding NtrC family response regulator